MSDSPDTGAETGADTDPETMPDTEELEEPSTEKEPGNEPKGGGDEEPPEADHEAVGIGVIESEPIGEPSADHDAEE
jgi:hypothetical protein